MKKIMLLLVALLSFAIMPTMAQKTVKLSPNVYAVAYTGVTADSVSATDTTFYIDVLTNKPSALYYNFRIKINDVTTSLTTTSVMGKIFDDDPWTTITSQAYHGTGSDTTITFTQNTTAQFYRYYRIKVVYTSGKASINYIKMYFKK